MNNYDKTQIQLYRESQPPKEHKRKKWPGVLPDTLVGDDRPPVIDVTDVTSAHYNVTDKLGGLI